MLKEKIKGIFRNVNLIFTHNEETKFLINFKNNKIQSTFNFNLENYYKPKKINDYKFFGCKWRIIFN